MKSGPEGYPTPLREPHSLPLPLPRTEDCIQFGLWEEEGRMKGQCQQGYRFIRILVGRGAQQLRDIDSVKNSLQYQAACHCVLTFITSCSSTPDPSSRLPLPSSSLPIVSSTNAQPTPAATTDSPANSTYTLPRLHRSRGITTNGITIAPIRPAPEHSPNPFVRVRVSKDSVVSGYRIWKTSFMKKRASDPRSTMVVAAKARWQAAAARKKRMRERRRPKCGWSMRQKLTRRLGISPATVRKYLERWRPAELEERWKASTTSCPLKVKLITIQQLTSAHTRRTYLPSSSTSSEWQSLLPSPSPSALLLSSNSALIASSSSSVSAALPLASSIFWRTKRPLSISWCMSRYLGDSWRRQSEPSSTSTLGMPPQTIMSFQLEEARSSLRKRQASATAQSLPREMQKLMSRMPLPREWAGLISANMLVLRATVNPKENPQQKRSSSITSSETAQQNSRLTAICSTAPQVISRRRPYRSASTPLVTDPARLPTQKMLASSSMVAGVACGKTARMMGLRRELKTSSTPSLASTRQRTAKACSWQRPRPTRSLMSASMINCYSRNHSNPDRMDLSVTNLSNELAKNNAVYISAKLAKDPARTVTVRINSKLLKCGFLPDLDRTNIAMSKNLREFLSTEVGKAVRVEPVSAEFEEEAGLSFLELELTQAKLTTRVKLEDTPIIDQVRTRERGSFFNLGEVKYVPIDSVLYTVRVVRCMAVQTGTNDRRAEGSAGRLLPDTQVQLRVPEGSLITLTQSTANETNIFRPDFRIEDMGIGGLDEELFNIFRRTFASRRYSAATLKRFGIKHVKGILLYGPPGTGKTLIARQLARALNVKDLKIVNGPEVFSKFVGQSEENIRKLFAEARADEQKLGDRSPLHIIVFDEIDAICKQRGLHGGVGAQVSDQVVNQLLTNIDGVEALNNIVVIGMTNRKDLLDEAILRPGRFEVHVEVHLPNAAGREQILGIHTRDLARNGLLGADCRLEELAQLTKNFTGAEIEALVKCASSHSISRTTNILDFARELVIDEKALRVEKQDFLKALGEVRPQFGVDEEKFGAYFRERVVNYGSSFQRMMSALQETTSFEGSSEAKRSLLLHGRPGTGKTLLAVNFCRTTPFSYLKIISPENLVGLTEGEKIRSITKVFEDAYRTTNACILIDELERLIDFSPIGRRLNNAVLQTLLLLLERAPPKETCRLLILATTSAYYHLQALDLVDRFPIKIEVPLLGREEIAQILREKYGVPEEIARKVGKQADGSSIKQLLEMADLVTDKNSEKEWSEIWENLMTAKQEEAEELDAE